MMYKMTHHLDSCSDSKLLLCLDFSLIKQPLNLAGVLQCPHTQPPGPAIWLRHRLQRRASEPGGKPVCHCSHGGLPGLLRMLLRRHLGLRTWAAQPRGAQTHYLLTACAQGEPVKVRTTVRIICGICVNTCCANAMLWTSATLVSSSSDIATYMTGLTMLVVPGLRAGCSS